MLANHYVLLKNERLKLYKKPSTWVLMGAIVLLTLFSLVINKLMFRSAGGYSPSWQEQYNWGLEDLNGQLKENPEEIYTAQSIEALKYLLENNISPQDLRTDLVFEYYNLKAEQLSKGEIPGQKQNEGKPIIQHGDWAKPGMEYGYAENRNMTDGERQERMEKLQSILKSNDWRKFIDFKIDDIKSGLIGSNSDQEKQVNIEMYELYRQHNIVPISDINNNLYYRGYGPNQENNDFLWKSREIETIRQNKLSVLRGEDENGNLLTKNRIRNLEQDINVALKRLSTNTAPISYNSFLGLLESSASEISLISILLIVYAGGIFASEYGSGTIKMLLITPHKRNKIFWSKTILMMELTAIALALNLALAFIFSGVFTAFKGIGSMQVMSVFGSVVQLPYLLYIVLRFLILVLPVLTYGALAMMMSVVTRKSAISIAATMMLMFGGNIVMGILSVVSHGKVLPGIKFLLFSNTELSSYLPSASSAFMGGMSSMVDGTMTLGFSVAVLAVYTVCFLWIAHDSFCRRDVK